MGMRASSSTDTLSRHRALESNGEKRCGGKSRIRFRWTAQGECLPRYDNYVELDPEKKDAWGIPVLHIHATYGENEHAMAKAMRQDVGNILDALKVKTSDSSE